jgi:predicted N-acetyltransferase YhbS
MDFEIVAFSKGYDRTGFDCGNDEMNVWLRTRAGQQERSNNTRTFLAISEGRIIGYYASLAYQLGPDEVSTALGIGNRQYPMPVILLARLAVAAEVQGNNIGRRLLLHFLQDMVEVSHRLGFEAVVVHALDWQAATFYAKCGFRPFCDKPLELFIPTKDLRRSFGVQ